MASVTYGKCYSWQMYYGKCNYGKNIYGKNIRANETEPFINETTDRTFNLSYGIITASSWGLSKLAAKLCKNITTRC